MRAPSSKPTPDPAFRRGLAFGLPLGMLGWAGIIAGIRWLW